MMWMWTFCPENMAATALRHAYVGVVGDSFEGMGDFAVPGEELKDRFGITVEMIMKGGKGVYVNVSRDKDDYQLLLVSAEFLKWLSKNGATHHSSFVYGATVEELEFFGELLAMKVVTP